VWDCTEKTGLPTVTADAEETGRRESGRSRLGSSNAIVMRRERALKDFRCIEIFTGIFYL
jgi:hypothetical protein